MKRRQLNILTFFFVASVGCVQSLPIIFNSSVSRQGNILFPAADSDNELTGFAWADAGFSLEDATTTCTFDSFCPISAAVNLNGGTLHLEQDLYLSNTLSFGYGGKIKAYDHAIVFPDGFTQLGEQSDGYDLHFEQSAVFFQSDATIEKTLVFKGDCILDGGGCALTLANNVELVIDAGSTLLMRNLCLHGVSDNDIRCLDSVGTCSLQKVVWILDGAYTFTDGHLDVLEDFMITGTGIFTYQSDQVSTIGSHAALRLDLGMTFSYDPPIADKSLLVMNNDTSRFYLQSATLHTTSTGLQLTKGTVFIDGASAFSNEGTVAGEGIECGNGVLADDITIVLQPAADLAFETGFVVSKNSGW